MPYTIEENKVYAQPFENLKIVVNKAINGLEGTKNSKKSTNDKIVAEFGKKILGNVLGERTHLEVNFASKSTDETELKIVAFPLDAVGQKLKFGARKGVTNKVLTWLYAHIDHHIEKGN